VAAATFLAGAALTAALFRPGPIVLDQPSMPTH